MNDGARARPAEQSSASGVERAPQGTPSAFVCSIGAPTH